MRLQQSPLRPPLLNRPRPGYFFPVPSASINPLSQSKRAIPMDGPPKCYLGGHAPIIPGFVRVVRFRALQRRLKHLEEQVIPTEEPRVWQVVYVDSDGTRELGPRIELPPSR